MDAGRGHDDGKVAAYLHGRIESRLIVVDDVARDLFFLTVFFAFALAFDTSTFAAVSIAEDDVAEESLNHSEMVAERPAETADMWFTISGTPSSVHFITMSLELTPNFFAKWWTLVVTAFFAKSCSPYALQAYAGVSVCSGNWCSVSASGSLEVDSSTSGSSV